MKASLFEFRHRWWVIFFIFMAAFLAYSIDPKNSAVAIADWSARLAHSDAARAPGEWYQFTFALGAVLVGVAAFLRTWGTSYLQAEVMRDSEVHTEKLLADGPYRHVRNPLYLGNILLSVGMGLIASRIGFLVLSIGMTVFVVRLILREESELLRDRGESYRNYCAAVPRLVPSLTARIPSAGNPAHWKQGIAAELMYWLIALAMAAFAWTLNLGVFWGVFTVAFFSSWLLKKPRKKDNPNRA